MGRWCVARQGQHPEAVVWDGSAPVDWVGLLTPFLLQVNGLAAQGKYEGSGEDGGAAAQSLYVANHAY